MPTLYLVDLHNSGLTSSKIKGTLNVAEGFTQTRSLRGCFPMVLPFDVPLDGIPADLGDFITKKQTAMLSLYPGYQHILYDAQIDSTGWVPDPAASGVSLGQRQTNSAIYQATSALSTGITTLASTPTTACLRWECFEYSYPDVNGSTGTRYYREVPSTAFKAYVQFNGAYQEVQSGIVFSIAPSNQGNQFKLLLDRGGAVTTTPAKVHIGGWSLIY